VTLAWSEGTYVDRDVDESDDEEATTSHDLDERGDYKPHTHFFGASHARSACRAVQEWQLMGGVPGAAADEDAESTSWYTPVGMRSVFWDWTTAGEPTEGPNAQPVWDALLTIEEAIAELDAAPLPAPFEANPIAARLDDYVERLFRLKRDLAVERRSISVDAANVERAAAVDWRSINSDQARGLPNGLRSEDGAILAASRIINFDVSLVESDAEEVPFD
jgi:hypothetical protein